MLETLEHIKARIEAAVQGASVEVVANASAAGQSSLAVDNAHAVAVAKFLREDASLRLDYASNVTGVDWLDTVVQEKRKVKQVIEGVEREIEETTEHRKPGYLEAVYHLYSMELKHGPLILRLRTLNRADNARVPSLTPVWRGAEFQEREIYDLFGIAFEGHPDLRRILMSLRTTVLGEATVADPVLRSVLAVLQVVSPQVAARPAWLNREEGRH